MKNKIVGAAFIIVFAVILVSTAYSAVKTDPLTEVKSALQNQVAAWNAGDLEKAMGFYWNSPEMLWISKQGIQKGYQPVLEGYRKDFADKSKMGVYSYESLFIDRLSTTSVYYVFKWKIELNGKRLMGGISSQIWKPIGGRWVITSEHAS